MKREPISPGECHIWLARAPAEVEPERARVFRSWLSEDEARRYQAFRFERHRSEFLVTRALVRTTLAAYTGIEPWAFRFELGAHGKPFVAFPEPKLSLSFNLSNTEGLVACLVALDLEVGVDVENVERFGETLSVADHAFSAREVTELRKLPAERQRERFFAYWTLKEAYIKARGLGLALPLDQFSFLLDESTDAIGIEFDARLADEPSAWQFARLRPSQTHALALAVKRGDRQNLELVVREVEPKAG